MHYINPIEILELNGRDAISIDNSEIKKAKKRLIADIELSEDGQYNYKGQSITKSDCERAILDLENDEKKEFYSYLTNNKALNDYLASGDERIFRQFHQDSIFKLPEFVNFISPYFTSRFERSLIQAFNSQDEELLGLILRTQVLISKSDINNAFRAVSKELENRIKEIDKIKNEIKEGESSYDEDDIEEVVDIVEDYFPAESINLLPSYFQSQINKIASSINNLQLEIWNNFDTTEVSLRLLEHLLKLNIESVGKPTFEKNYKIVKAKHEERIEQEKNEPLLKKWADVLINLRQIGAGIENKTLKPKDVLNSISTISIEDLNSLPSFADEIRISIAYALRGIAVSIWNIHRDIEASISTITKATNINLPSDDKTKLGADLTKLKELKKEKDAVGEPIESAPSLGTFNGWGTTMIDSTLCFTILWIPIFPIARYSYKSQGNSYRFYGKLPLHQWQKVYRWIFVIGIIGGIIYLVSMNNSNSYSSSNSTSIYSNGDNNYSTSENTTPSYAEPIVSESKYKGNQLIDGASPLDGCFGKGVYSGNATLTIKNGGSSDAIICLYSISLGRTIRNEYVRKNSSFTMSKIAQGNYKVRVFYGNDWNPDLNNSCGTKGSFENDIHFSEFDGTEYFEDDETGYTVATITLYTVAGGNASSTTIDQSRFFNN